MDLMFDCDPRECPLIDGRNPGHQSTPINPDRILASSPFGTPKGVIVGAGTIHHCSLATAGAPLNVSFPFEKMLFCFFFSSLVFGIPVVLESFEMNEEKKEEGTHALGGGFGFGSGAQRET